MELLIIVIVYIHFTYTSNLIGQEPVVKSQKHVNLTVTNAVSDTFQSYIIYAAI